MLGLSDRGVIMPGAFADLVVFDYATLHGNDDYQNVTKGPEGITHVLVNGKVAFENKQHTGIRSGRTLRHT